ncbi:MAG TPA: hypothetical protein VFE65_29800 [Pseudonocardia sp.]|nr:hypothetical protein [Pseudonocardia sp.]
MSLAWDSLLIVIVVSFVAAVAVVALVAFALVGFSARAATQASGELSGTRNSSMSAGAGTAVGGVCIAAAALIVLYGLYIMIPYLHASSGH